MKDKDLDSALNTVKDANKEIERLAQINVNPVITQHVEKLNES